MLDQIDQLHHRVEALPSPEAADKAVFGLEKRTTKRTFANVAMVLLAAMYM